MHHCIRLKNVLKAEDASKLTAGRRVGRRQQGFYVQSSFYNHGWCPVWLMLLKHRLPVLMPRTVVTIIVTIIVTVIVTPDPARRPVARLQCSSNAVTHRGNTRFKPKVLKPPFSRWFIFFKFNVVAI